MILDEQDVKKLGEIITLAKTIGIEGIIIDGNSVRGQSVDGLFIITDHNIEQFKKTPIGITRVSVLFSRLNLIAENKKAPKVELEFKERDNGDKIVMRLKIKNNRTTIDFRCGDPLMIKTKQTLKDALIYSFDLSEETIDLMIRSNAAMQTDKIKLILDNEKVYFNINDTEGDSLKHLVSEAVTLSDPTKTSFLVSLKHKIVLPLFKLALKEKDKINIKISEIRNVITFELNGINVYIMPEV
jgi:hypothetical protein